MEKTLKATTHQYYDEMVKAGEEAVLQMENVIAVSKRSSEKHNIIVASAKFNPICCQR